MADTIAPTATANRPADQTRDALEKAIRDGLVVPPRGWPATQRKAA